MRSVSVPATDDDRPDAVHDRSMTEPQTFDALLDQVGAAAAAIRSGDPEPYIDCWADTDDVTLFGAWGPIEKGHERLVETFRWVGGRFQGGSAVSEHSVAFAQRRPGLHRGVRTR
jgi:hypothetical protein